MFDPNWRQRVVEDYKLSKGDKTYRIYRSASNTYDSMYRVEVYLPEHRLYSNVYFDYERNFVVKFHTVDAAKKYVEDIFDGKVKAH